MNIEQMKKVAHSFHIEVIQNQKLDLAYEIMAPDAIIKTPLRPPNDTKRGPEVLLAMAEGDAVAFPDGLFFDHDEAIAEGNMVSIRWDAHGNNTGPLGSIPPANKEIASSGVVIYVFNEKGQIAGGWVYYDVLSILKQVGAEVKLPGS